MQVKLPQVIPGFQGASLFLGSSNFWLAEETP